ncbi:hypothetical protein ACWEPC_05180 [Nonomuraea sp. NPDC004297]
MTTLLAGLILLLALVTGALAEAGPGARTPGQVAAGIAAATARGRLGWLAAVLLITPLFAALVATRATLWLALAVLTWTACRLTTALAMDGRTIRLARMAGGRA